MKEARELMAVSSKWVQALQDALEYMENDSELEPTSALKQAGKDNGISYWYGSEMRKFVAWASRQRSMRANNEENKRERGGMVMSRERMTRRRSARKSVLAEIEDLDRELKDEDAALLSDAQAIADEEVETVTERGETDVFEDIGEENARANDNWPMEAAEREGIARRLVTLAKKLVG